MPCLGTLAHVVPLLPGRLASSLVLYYSHPLALFPSYFLREAWTTAQARLDGLLMPAHHAHPALCDCPGCRSLAGSPLREGPTSLLLGLSPFTALSFWLLNPLGHFLEFHQAHQPW